MTLLTRPVQVPANFIGLSTNDLVAAPGTITHATVRSWDYRGDRGAGKNAVMCYINTSAGVYDWGTFDELFSNNTTKDVIFTLGHPADYLVSGAAVGGAYLGGKSNMCPTDLSGWATAVTAVVSRAKNMWGRAGLKWELWNEIDQTSCYNDTASLLGPYTKTTAAAIRAVDPTAIVLSPSIAGPSQVATMRTYLTASDGASGTSATWLDGLAWHYYNQTVYAYEHPQNYAVKFQAMRDLLKSLSLTLPHWVTETGVLSTDSNMGLALQRRLAVFAAMGAQVCLGYTYDNASYPINSVVSAWNTMAAILHPGAVISYCSIGVGTMNITVDNVSYTL